MRKALMLAAASAIVLAACQPTDQPSESRYAEETASAPAADAAPLRTETAGSDGAAAPVPLAPPASIAKIAYAFSYVLSVPKDRGAELMSRHELACASAGPG
ncbi:MAG: hypothetical protein U1E18_09280 [Brevundimonas sp.]|uniref:hypothetical protein n=1 Tax=Brevundimonas sp. TaxID=1871086 RepID=UPI002AB96F63|nr:hypothetical protein [Brevundimonas sp.]MDZ4109774.1 hypothetical protein [Brevundimonas sp.]